MAEGLQGQSNGVSDLIELPADCIANVISLTSPKDACRMSLVSTWLRSIADSDQVWEKFLPTDYRELLSRSTEVTELLRRRTSKKQLYLDMCHNLVSIDGQTKWCFYLDKPTGTKSFILGARDLFMPHMDHPQQQWFWKFTSLPESRFSSAAEQISNISRLRIRGSIKPRFLSAGTRYQVYLVFRMGKGCSYGNGLMEAPQASVGFQNEKRRFVTMHPSGVVKRSDGWLEVKLGHVSIDGKEDAGARFEFNQVTTNWL